MNVDVQPTLQIAQLLYLLKRVDGRTKMQKMVHILQELGHPFAERFDYSYYGMYSAQLRTELDALESEKLIVEEPKTTVMGDATYTFKSTSELEKFLKEIEADTQPAWGDLARRLNALSTQILEGVSTILFLRRAGLKGEELKTRLLALKPHLKPVCAECEKQLKSLDAFAEG